MKVQMKKVGQLLLLIALISSTLYSQSTNVDSLALVLKKLPDGDEKIMVLNQLLKLNLNSDLDKARNYGHQAASLSKKTNNELALASAYKDLGVTHIIASNYDSCWYYYQMAKSGFEKLLRQEKGGDMGKTREGYAGTIVNIGTLYYYQAKLDTAVKYLQQGVELSEKCGALKVKANGLGTLSFIYMDQAKYDDAIEMQFETLHTFEKLDDKEGISRSYQGLGQIYCDYLKKCDLSLNYYRKALALKKSLGNERGEAYVRVLMGYAHEKLSAIDSAALDYEVTIKLAEKTGDKRLLADGLSALCEIWMQQGKPFSQRIEIAERLVKTAKEAEYELALCSAYMQLSSIYQDKGDIEKSIYYCNLAVPLAEKLKQYSYLETIYHKLYTNYKGHDPAKALEALQSYLINHDSVANADRFRAVEDISTKYETAKKEATIAQQSTRLQQERTRFWLISGILVLAIAVGLLLFRLTRQLRKRNEEKEFLIKEIHHRVKNNLQVLSSLLHLQSRHIKDEAVLDAVREGQNRVEAMGLIHQKLYMGERLAAVDMQDYLHSLGDTLLDSFGLDDDQVKISFDLQPLRLDVDTAIPLGLIINELVTNSLKYAFPEGKKGEVVVSLWKEAGLLCLKVADNGVGRAGAPQLKNSTSFGTNLVEILSKKLKGKPAVSDNQGYSTVIKFENYKSVN